MKSVQGWWQSIAQQENRYQHKQQFDNIVQQNISSVITAPESRRKGPTKTQLPIFWYDEPTFELATIRKVSNCRYLITAARGNRSNGRAAFFTALIWIERSIGDR